MKLEFTDTNKEGPSSFTLEDNLLTFYCISPIIIQPAEIVKVTLGVVFKIPAGWVLNLSTHPNLYEKAGELFPALIVLDSSHQEKLVLPIRNNGRNPLNLMPGNVIGQGYFIKVEEIESQEGLLVDTLPQPLSRTAPQRKDPFRFEVIK